MDNGRQIELGRSDELFRLVVEAAPNAMLMVNRDGLITLVNQQVEKLFRYTRDELLGQKVEMLLPQALRSSHPARRDGFFDKPTTRFMGVGRDLYGMTKDGVEVPIEIGLNPIQTDRGSFVLASIIDITERKRAEERIRLVVEAAPNAMLMISRDGLISLVNAQTENLFGYTREQLIGQPVEMLVPPTHRAQHPELRRSYFASPRTRSMGVGRELFGLTRDGRQVPIEIGLNPIATMEGTFVLASIIDITERKRADEIARRGDARFRQIVEAAPNAMLMVSRDGVITLVNRQAERLFGYGRQELLGKKIETLVPYRIRAQHPGLRDGFFADLTTRSMGVGRDLFGLTKGGVEVPIEIGLNPIDTDEGAFVLASIIDITERKRLESRFRLVVEAAPNAMLMINREGLVTLVNAQTEKMFGYSRAELIGQPVEKLVPERIRPGHPKLRESYFANPRTRSMGVGQDLFGVARNGREIPIEIGLNPIDTDQGTFVLASIIDISERKRAEDAARTSDARFRQMVSSVKDYAILMLDAQGRIASWNEGSERLKGYSEEEVLGKHFSIFYPVKEVEAGKPERELRQAVEQGRFEDEGWRVRKDGSQFWGNVIITPMRDEHGEVTGFSKVTRDMTDRRRSDERFRLVVEAAPNAMLMVSREGFITLVNRQAEKLFGYTREQLLGNKVEMLLPVRNRGGHRGQREGFFGNPTTRSMGVGRDLFGLTRDGREVPIEIGLNPIDTDEGSFVLASIIDITERKKGEQALVALNKTLEAQVDETRRALAQLKETQGQLVQAEKLASLGGLVAGVAHEINTPIGVGVTAASHLRQEVRAMKKAMDENTLTRAAFDRYAQVYDQSSDIILLNLQRAADLIRSFKRVAVDQSSDERRRVNLKAYIEEVLLSLRPKLKGTQHQLTLDCADDLQVETTPGALSQILTNLVVNALTHAFEPGKAGKIRIEVARAKERIELKFSDDGVGIPPEHLSRIFDPFFTTRRGQGGTGLGLHIVFNLVQQALGGTIQVSSQPGHGTAFLLTF